MSQTPVSKPRPETETEPGPVTLPASVDWRSAQAEHHRHKARVLVAYATAYESEANSATSAEQRTYLNKRGREFRKDAEGRLLMVAKLGAMS